MSEWKQPTPIQLAKRVEKWQHRLAHLGISHFRISAVHLVSDTPGGPRAQASVCASEHYDSAEFWFRWEFIEECTERQLDETIVHEWVHVAWRDFDESVRGAESWMPSRTYDDFEERITHEREGLVERLTRTIIDLYYDAKKE